MQAFRIWPLILLAGLSNTLSAQPGSLTGIWKLNVKSSFMGADHPAKDYALTKTIEQKDNVVSIRDTTVNATTANIPLPDSTWTLTLVLDGKEHEIELPSPYPGYPPYSALATGRWEGGTLRIGEIAPGSGVRMIQRLFLSEDSSQLIVTVEQHSTYTDREQRLVFDRKQ
jgi:hypothetical protein